MEIVDPIPRLAAAVSPPALAGVNRNHCDLEIMQGNNDVIPSEHGQPNSCANAPRTIFSRTGFAFKIPRKLLNSVSPSPTLARNRAVRLDSDFP